MVEYCFLWFLDAATHLYTVRGRVRPSVHRSVGPTVRPSVPCYFQTTNMAVFEVKKLSNDIIINDTMSDVEVVAYPRGTCFIESERQR